MKIETLLWLIAGLSQLFLIMVFIPSPDLNFFVGISGAILIGYYAVEMDFILDKLNLQINERR